MSNGGLPLKKDQKVLLLYMVAALILITVLEVWYYLYQPKTDFTRSTSILTRLFQDIRYPILIFALIFNASMAVLLFRLRVLSEKFPLTLSQKWALSILAWLFLLNTFQLAIFTIRWLGTDVIGDDYNGFFYRVEKDLVILTYLPLLAFGLTYPRPMMKWNHLKKAFLALGAVWILFIIVQSIFFGREPVLFLGNPDPFLKLLYLPVCFIPIFLWIPEYSKQNSPEMRMILTILIWGYLFYIVSLEGGWLFGISSVEGFYYIGLIAGVLILLSYIYIMKVLYHRRGRWLVAEWTNLGLMAVSISSAVILGLILRETGFADPAIGWNQGYAALFLMTSFGGWMLIRPTLFSYGMLRYQFFGPGVKAGKSFQFVLTILGVSIVFLILTYLVGQFNIAVGFIVGIIGAGALFIPIHRFSKNIVAKFLPMSEGSKAAPLTERRATYLMGLQTAVVEGRIETEIDKDTLKGLREDLRVSDREHDLLMDGFAKEKPEAFDQEIEEAYIFHKDGALLGYSAQREVKRRGKSGMMGAMVSTVGNFSRDAMIKGSDRVEAIEYGNVTLIVEIEEDVALGVILRGKDNPQVRARMRDVLRAVHEKYPKAIQNFLAKGAWETRKTTMSHIKGLERLLNDFITEAE
jgi:hypothetical protein